MPPVTGPYDFRKSFTAGIWPSGSGSTRGSPRAGKSRVCMEMVMRRAVDSPRVAVTMSAAGVRKAGLDDDSTRPCLRCGHGRPGRACGPGDGRRAARPADHGAAGRAGPPQGRHRDQPAGLEEPGLHRRPRHRQVTRRRRNCPPIPGSWAAALREPDRDPRHRPAGPTARDTAAQVTEAVKVTGDLVMITGAHAWHDLPGHGQHILRCLYQILTEARKYHGDELAIILAGQAGPLRDMLHATPALAARFPPS